MSLSNVHSFVTILPGRLPYSQADADAAEMVYRYLPPIAAALQTSTQQLPYPRFNHHHDGSWCHGHNIGFWSELKS